MKIKAETTNIFKKTKLMELEVYTLIRSRKLINPSIINSNMTRDSINYYCEN